MHVFRRLLRYFGVFVILNIVYIGLSYLYINSEHFQEWLRRKPTQFQFAQAISPLPGIFLVHDLQASWMGENAGWSMRFDKALFRVAALPLLEREFDIKWGKAEGGKLVFKAQREQNKTSSKRAKTPGRKQSRWALKLNDLVFEDVREINLNQQIRFTGKMQLHGSYHRSRDRTIRIPYANFTFTSIQVFSGDVQVGQLEAIRSHLSLGDFQQGKDDLGSLLETISAELEFEAELIEMSPVTDLLANVSWLHLSGDGGTLKAKLALEQGRFLPGSKLILQSRTLSAQFLKQRVSGKGQIIWEITNTDQEAPGTRAHVLFDQYELRRQGQKTAEVVGQNLSLMVKSSEDRLVGRFKSWTADLSMPPANIVSLQYVNVYLPQAFDLKVTNGTGSITGHIHAASDKGRPSRGRLEIKANQAGIQYENIKMVGDIIADFKLDDLNIDKGQFHMSQSHISFSDILTVDQGQKEGTWSGKIAIPSADFQLLNSQSFAGRIVVEGQDLRPLLAIYMDKKRLPHWLIKSVRLKQLHSHFTIKVNEERLFIQDLEATAKGLILKGWLQKTRKNRFGKLLVRYRKLTVGLGVEGDDFKFKVVRARQWYQNRDHL